MEPPPKPKPPVKPRPPGSIGATPLASTPSGGSGGIDWSDSGPSIESQLAAAAPPQSHVHAATPKPAVVPRPSSDAPAAPSSAAPARPRPLRPAPSPASSRPASIAEDPDPPPRPLSETKRGSAPVLPALPAEEDAAALKAAKRSSMAALPALPPGAATRPLPDAPKRATAPAPPVRPGEPPRSRPPSIAGGVPSTAPPPPPSAASAASPAAVPARRPPLPPPPARRAPLPPPPAPAGKESESSGSESGYDDDLVCDDDGPASAAAAAPAPIDPTEFIYQGFLEKKGQQRHSWKKRWFVLRAGSLAYMETAQATASKGELVLSRGLAVESLPSTELPEEFRLSVSVPGRNLIVRAVSDAARRVWLGHLEALAARLPSFAPPTEAGKKMSFKRFGNLLKIAKGGAAEDDGANRGLYPGAVRQGYMERKAELRPGWKRRWVVLFPSKISFFEPRKPMEPFGDPLDTVVLTDGLRVETPAEGVVQLTTPVCMLTLRLASEYLLLPWRQDLLAIAERGPQEFEQKVVGGSRVMRRHQRDDGATRPVEPGTIAQMHVQLDLRAASAAGADWKLRWLVLSDEGLRWHSKLLFGVHVGSPKGSVSFERGLRAAAVDTGDDPLLSVVTGEGTLMLRFEEAALRDAWLRLLADIQATRPLVVEASSAAASPGGAPKSKAATAWSKLQGKLSALTTSDARAARPDHVYSAAASSGAKLTGYIEKRGEKNRTYKWRWFVLTDREMLYYDPPSGGDAATLPNPKGAVPLSEPFDLEVGAHDDGDSGVENDVRFAVTVPGRRFDLRVESKADRTRWLAALRTLPECQDVEGRVFGKPLEALVSGVSELVPAVLSNCVTFIVSSALQSEGIFRLSGRASEVEDLRRRLNGDQNAALAGADPYVVAAVVKRLFREMPEPLLSFGLYDEFIACVREDASHETRLSELYCLVQALSPVARASLAVLAGMMAAVAANAESNKMTLSNLAVCITPNILYSRNTAAMLLQTKQQQAVVSLIVEYRAYVFSQG